MEGKFSPPPSAPAGNSQGNNQNNANAQQITIGPSIKFSIKHAFGCVAPKIDPLLSFSASSTSKDYQDRVIHKVGKHVCVFDPESSKQEFFDSRGKNVVDVVHFTISHNSRYIAMCEILRAEKNVSIGDNLSQVSIYSLSTLNRLKTLHHPTPKPFACSTFCGDIKYLAALSEDPDRYIVVWQWEKEKMFKTVAVNVNATLLRCAPCPTLMMTTSGASALKSWCVSPDGTLKPSNLLPPAKETLDVYLDHVWLASNVNHHRMVALVDPDSSNDINKNRKQAIYIFEGNDNGQMNAAGSVGPIVPINLELKQTITIRVDTGCRIEKIVPTVKAFFIVGLFGFICIYDKTDDKHEPYIESRRFTLGDLHLVGATILPSEEKMVLLNKTGRILTFQMDVSIEQAKKASIMAYDDDQSVQSLEVDSATGSMSSAVGGKNEAKRNSGINDLTKGGYHYSPIIASDVAYERPLIATIGTDSILRVWNYMTWKCEIVHHFRNDEPQALAFNTSGFQLLVSFKDRIRLYNVLMDKIKQCRETILKNCKCLRFSHGSQYWAAASGINVVVYESRSFQQLMTFQGHMMTVVRLCWAPGDQVLFSAGSDGNIYGWPIAREGRIEVISANNRGAAILDLVVDSPSSAFPAPTRESEDDHVAISTKPKELDPNIYDDFDHSWLVFTSLDGHLRMPSWSIENVKSQLSLGYSHHTSSNAASNASTAAIISRGYVFNDGIPVIYGDANISMTCLVLSSDRMKLFVGTNIGSLRVYNWPPDPQFFPKGPNTAPITSPHDPGFLAQLSVYQHHNLCAEFFLHNGPIVGLKLGTLENTLITMGQDGSIFIFTYVDEKPKKKAITFSTNATNDFLHNFALDEDEENMKLNQDVALLAIEDVEEHVNEVIELQKLLSETRAKNEFQIRKIESENNESMKKIHDVHETVLQKEKDLYEKQRQTYDKRLRELMNAIELKESDHVKIITELENKYEHKLTIQLNRYDLLSEKMALLKQKCEGLLSQEKEQFMSQINQLKQESNQREKKLRVENRRTLEDKLANESAFREIISQQEDEYEDELKVLIQAAENELITERDIILKLRTLIQTKNTKLDQLKKKFSELQTASKARMTLLNKEKDEKNSLLEIIEHYKKNLIEREDALAEKEKLVIELRSKCRTLENFRFVLDHRLQQLSSERGPITTHIEHLEKHISTIYEELVEEFSNKKTVAENMELKDQKIRWMSDDLNKIRQDIREKETYISQFKRELSNIVTSMVSGKELEESIKILYRKFVKGEKDLTKSIVKLNSHVNNVVNDLIQGNQPSANLMAKLNNSSANNNNNGKNTSSLRNTNNNANNKANEDDQSFLSVETMKDKGANGNNNNSNNANLGKSFLKEVEEALVETAHEAERQKKFVEKQSLNLKHRLVSTEKEAHLLSRVRLHENSDLLYECNELRVENKELHRKIDILRHDLEQSNRKIHEMQVSHLYTKSPSKRSLSPSNPLDATNNTSNTMFNMDQTQETPMIVMSKSMPILSLDAKHDTNFAMTAPNVVLEAGVTLDHGYSQPNLRGGKILSARSQGGSRTPGKLVSLNIPSVNKTKGSKDPLAGTPHALATATTIQIDRLNKEVDSLAYQLDEANREREMQRIELSRLRKQMMNISQLPNANNPSLTLGGSFANSMVSQDNLPPEQTTSAVIQLPSLMNASHSMESLPGSNSSANPKLTHADIYGFPSEDEKKEMRVGPNSSLVSAQSIKSRASIAKKSSISAGNNLDDNKARSKSREGSSGKDLRELSLHSYDSN